MPVVRHLPGHDAAQIAVERQLVHDGQRGAAAVDEQGAAVGRSVEPERRGAGDEPQRRAQLRQLARDDPLPAGLQLPHLAACVDDLEGLRGADDDRRLPLGEQHPHGPRRDELQLRAAVVVLQDPLVVPTRPRVAARAVLAHPDAVPPAAAVDQEDRAGSRVRGKARAERERGERATAASSGPGYRRTIRSATMTVRKLLVANRGEIAVRVFRTCRELGIATVAVAAPDDAGALHARTADETVAVASYLHSEEHIRAAMESGADAIHPGYGFLAENADFAEAVTAAGLTWIGPPPEALRLGGDKLAAKRIAAEAGVPVVPTGEPAALGYPAARQGGGGRRRAWHAGRARAGGAGRGARGRGARGRGGVRRRHRLLRALRRAAAPRRDPDPRRRPRHGALARRARLLRPAAPPEGARGVALPGARPGAAGGDERGGGRVRERDRLRRARARPSSCSTAASSGSSS